VIVKAKWAWPEGALTQHIFSLFPASKTEIKNVPHYRDINWNFSHTCAKSKYRLSSWKGRRLNIQSFKEKNQQGFWWQAT